LRGKTKPKVEKLKKDANYDWVEREYKMEQERKEKEKEEKQSGFENLINFSLLNISINLII
jgi:hypothetical protein